MYSKNRTGAFVIAALALGVSFCFADSAALAGQKWTIDTRSAKLMQEINDGQKNGSLTLKEAKKLRSDLADIAHHKHEKKLDNNDKVSDEEKNKIEGELNKVSAKIKKLELDKRVTHK
jgi:exo-beta-1,3-glucanase (GH17 family)